MKLYLYLYIFFSIYLVLLINLPTLICNHICLFNFSTFLVFNFFHRGGYKPIGFLLCHSLLVPYCTIASFENNNAAMWEQASPSLAIHVQWAARTLPSGSAMIQESSGFSHILWVWSTCKYRGKNMRVMSTKIGMFCLNN